MKTNRDSGFTLLEMLVTLVIFSLSLVVVAPNLGKVTKKQSMNRVATHIAKTLNDTRGAAIRSNSETLFIFDINDKSYRNTQYAAEHELPDNILVKVIAAKAEFVDPQTPTIRFYPDGSSTGGSITLSRNKSLLHIDVDWLTGLAVVKKKHDT